MKTTREPELFDVVIYEIKTREIDTIAGTDMQRDTGFYNAEKRLETVWPRLNEHYGAVIVPAGKYKKGDKLRFYEDTGRDCG